MRKVYSYLESESGVIQSLPLIIIVVAVGIIAYLLISSAAPFKDGFFGALNPKPESHAANLNPTPYFASYLGGSGYELPRDMAVDKQGNFYVTGGTQSADFPTTAGAYSRTNHTSCNPGGCGAFGPMDVFVTKYSPAGQVIWSTLLGGPNYDRAYGIEVDDQGFVYIAGRASVGFPTTPGVVQPNFAGDVLTPNGEYGQQDGFITKLSPDGSKLIWSTYLGTNDYGVNRDMAIDPTGNVYVVMLGAIKPTSFITANAFQKTNGGGAEDNIVAKISADGTKIIYASYLGGNGDDNIASIRVNALGEALVATSTSSTNLFTSPNAPQKTYGGGLNDFYVTKISADGSKQLWATYFGGSGDDTGDTHILNMDSQGNAILGGSTSSPTLPGSANGFQKTNGGGYDGFAAKISADGSTIIGSSFIGGSKDDGGEGTAVDGKGDPIISGGAGSANFPVTSGAVQSTLRGSQNGYVAKFSSDLKTLLYSSYFGGSGTDAFRALDVDLNGVIYAAGPFTSTNFTTTANAPQKSYGGGTADAVVIRVDPNPTTSPTPTISPSASPISTNTPTPVLTPTPKPTLSPTPIPTPTPRPSATIAPTPTVTPTPVPTPTPSPTTGFIIPSAPSVNTSALTCVPANGYTGGGISFSWNNPVGGNPVSWIDIGTDSGFNSFYNRNVSGLTSISGPAGFNLYAGTGAPALTILPNTTYSVRLYNDTLGMHSASTSFRLPVCVTSTPVPTIAPTPTPVTQESSVLTITAGGQSGVFNNQTIRPTMVLNINGSTKQTWTNVGGNGPQTQFLTFIYQSPTKIIHSQVIVNFTNDNWNPTTGQDVNLYVQKINIDGVDYPSNAASVLSSGVWTPSTGCSVGNKQSIELSCNGYFQY